MTPLAGTEVPATQAVRVSGVEHAVGFLGGPAGGLFVSLHIPVAGARASLVMCPPILADHPFSYRRELLTANELAQRGVAVWRFHYAGTGYSDGKPEEMSFDSLVADAGVVVEAAAAAAPVPVAIAGTRCGAMVAAAVADDRPLVLWEAVTDGSAYLREGFRARMIADGGQLRRTPPTSAQLLAELRRTGRIELLGYSLYERLHDSLAGRRLQDLVRASKVLVIGSPTSSDAAAVRLRELGADVTCATVGIAEAWWFHRTQQTDHAAIAAELADVIDPWLPRSEGPVAITPRADASTRTAGFIDTGAGSVFALLTPPGPAPRGEAVLLLWGGGGMPAFGRNGVASALARRIAGRGYHVLQIDYSGRGDSAGAEPPDPIDEPTRLQVFAAARAAYGRLEAQGISRVLTIGVCQGAVAALNTADAAPTLTGLALLAPAIAETFEAGSAGGEPCGVVSPMHPRMRGSFDAVVRNGTPLLLAYGVDDEGFQSFQAAMDGELGDILRPAGDRVTVALTQERIHGFMTVSGQEATVELVMAWLEKLGG